MDTVYNSQEPVTPTVEATMDESELLRIIESEEQSCTGQYSGDLSNQRAKAWDYYLGQPFGDEIEGRSQVVSSDVYDAVEGMLPSLIDIFTSSDKAVEFTANGHEDEEQSRQITDACNYVFYRQNNGFLILYTWIKDALVSKNGIVKFYYEDKKTKKKESYRGLTDQQLFMLAQSPDVEVVSHNAYPDPMAQQMMQQAMMQYQMQAQQAMAMGQQPPPPPQMPMLHDVDIEVSNVYGKVCIDNVPPEEFRITARHTSLSLQDCEFCEHVTQVPISELRELGYEVDEIESGSGGYDRPFATPEELARNKLSDEMSFGSNDSADESMKRVWVCEAYIRVDYDGDGIAELRKVLKVGKQILANEEVDLIPFAAITPNIMPHQFYGLSLYDIIADIQHEKSVLRRQMLDNLYLTNMPRMAVLSSPSGAPQASLDDLLTSRPGGIIRQYVPGAVTPIETRFVAQASFPMLEYLDGVKENRTGITRYNQGLDADSLNKTAHGVMAIMNAAQQRTRLVARIIAETGVKDLFKGIMHCLSKYSMKPLAMRLRNKFVTVDPRQWKTQWDMVVNVGLGTGDKSQQLQHLGAILELQKLFLAGGKGHLVTDENLYNSAAEMVENAGLKYVDAYFTNPAGKPPPPQPPNPEIVKVQAEMQLAQAEMQNEQKLEVFKQNAAQQEAAAKMQMERFAAELKAQTDLQIAQMEIASKERIEQMKIRSAADIAIFTAQNDASIKGAELEHDDRKTDKQLAAKEVKGPKSAQILNLKTGEDVTEEIRKQTELVADAMSGLGEQSKVLATAIKSTEQLAKNVSQVSAAVSGLEKKIAQTAAKPKRRVGSYNGKPFEVTES